MAVLTDFIRHRVIIKFGRVTLGLALGNIMFFSRITFESLALNFLGNSDDWIGLNRWFLNLFLNLFFGNIHVKIDIHHNLLNLLSIILQFEVVLLHDLIKLIVRQRLNNVRIIHLYVLDIPANRCLSLLYIAATFIHYLLKRLLVE